MPLKKETKPNNDKEKKTRETNNPHGLNLFQFYLLTYPHEYYVFKYIMGFLNK